MITPPGQNKSRKGWRALIEATAQLTPPTAFLSRIYQTTYPGDSEIETQEWQALASTKLNLLLGGRLKTFGRVDFNGTRYSWGESQNILSMSDLGVGRHAVNLLAPITEDYIVDVQADDGNARVTQKSATNFSIKIHNDGNAIDSGFVFIVRTCSG